jgi:hypothetical protein
MSYLKRDVLERAGRYRVGQRATDSAKCRIHAWVDVAISLGGLGFVSFFSFFLKIEPNPSRISNTKPRTAKAMGIAMIIANCEQPVSEQRLSPLNSNT